MGKGKLFLSGGGDIDETLLLDAVFFSHLQDGGRILYIPIAMDTHYISYDACCDWFTRLLSKHCLNKEVDFTLWTEKEPVPIVSMFDAVYIGGGNTYHLMKTLRKYSVDKQLQDFFLRGGLIYGGSAGAIIMGKTIATVQEENTMGYNLDSGLDLLNGFSIKCHFLEKDVPFLQQYSIRFKHPIIALPETTGVIFDTQTFSVYGDPIVLFKDDNYKEIQLSVAHA